MISMNGAVLKAMLESGCNNLNNRKKEVDALNVFPVPDGDTGTNMSLTFTNGIAEIRKYQALCGYDPESIQKTVSAMLQQKYKDIQMEQLDFAAKLVKKAKL